MVVQYILPDLSQGMDDKDIMERVPKCHGASISLCVVVFLLRAVQGGVTGAWGTFGMSTENYKLGLTASLTA